MEELKSCPFCGGIAETVRDVEHQSDAVFVRCTKCGVRTKSVVYNARKHPHGEEYEEAWSLWNRRAAQESKALALEELRQMDGEPVWIETMQEWRMVLRDSSSPNDTRLWTPLGAISAANALANGGRIYAHKPGKEKWSYKDILKQEG